MTPSLRAFFDAQKIEYAAVVPYDACVQIRPDIMAREDFTPRSAILFLLPYYAGECVNLSRYAASLDYHILIRELTGALCERLGEEYPGSHSRGYGDHSPLDERHAALIAGLGILGDSGLLLNEKYGSYVFIADVLTDIPPQVLGAVSPQTIGHCPHCGRCAAACPTGILRGESDKCLSAITQRKGELTDEEEELMRRCHTVWGCDECSCHCPYNAHPPLTPLSFFYRERLPELTRPLLDAMDKAAFSRRAFAWRGRRTVERNLAVFEKADTPKSPEK